MATRAVQQVVTYRAWDTSANAPKTGDVANHTLRWVKDGVSAATTNSPTEVDATNAKGTYKVTLTNTECDALMGTLAGVSSTANVAIFGPQIAFEQIPNAVPGAANGLLIAGVNAPVTIQGSGDALTITSTGANGRGVVLSSNGSGAALETAGGTTGQGFKLRGGATSGIALDVQSNGGSHGAQMVALAANGSGLNLQGSGLGHGLGTTGGATGDGLRAVAGGGGTSVDIRGNITGALNGNVLGSLSGTVGSVLGAVASVSGNVGGSVASVVAGVTVTLNNDKTGYSLTVAEENAIRDAIFARAFSAAYNSLTFDQIVKLAIAALAGKCSGMGTTTGTFRNLLDSADAIVATIDVNGNRSAVTLTP